MIENLAEGTRASWMTEITAAVKIGTILLAVLYLSWGVMDAVGDFIDSH